MYLRLSRKSEPDYTEWPPDLISSGGKREIETVEQAIMNEMDVESGYYKIIDENIRYLIAAEEDIVDCYTRPPEEADDEEVKSRLAEIVEGKKHVRTLKSVKESLANITSDARTYAKLLRDLAHTNEYIYDPDDFGSPSKNDHDRKSSDTRSLVQFGSSTDTDDAYHFEYWEFALCWNWR